MRPRHIPLLPLLSLLLIGCAADQPRPFTPGQSQQTFQTTVRQDVTLKYLLHLPAGYGTDGRAWPTMLFLHGAGERGDNLDLVKVHGPPKLAEADPGFPFIVISPQCPPGRLVVGRNDAVGAGGAPGRGQRDVRDR